MRRYALALTVLLPAGVLGTVGAPPAGADTSIEVIDAVGNTFSGYPSLEFDAAGNPVVSYSDFLSGELRLAHCDDPNCAPGGDSVVVVDSGGIGSITSLELDAAGNPVISYFDTSNRDLKLAHCDDPDCAPGGDSIVTVDSDGSVGDGSSLELDEVGNPVISYTDTTNSALNMTAVKLAHCDDPDCAPGGDSIVTVESDGLTFSTQEGLELDAAGNPVISYFKVIGDPMSGFSFALRLAHCDDPDCAPTGDSIVTVEASANAGLDPSLVLDGAGNPVIGYTGFGDVRLARCHDPDCASGSDRVVVGTTGGGTVGTSLVLDASGNPAISYPDRVTGTVSVARCDDPSCAPGGNSIVVVDSADVIGERVSLNLDALGNPVIAYADWTNGEFKLAHCDNGFCDVTPSKCLGEPATVVGGTSQTTVLGTPGDDVIVARAPGATIVPGGGRDKVCATGGDGTVSYADSASGVVAALGAGTVLTSSGLDRLEGIANVVGSTHRDVLLGDGRTNELSGGAGDDLIAGLGGADTLDGGEGKNLLLGEPADTCVGVIAIGC